MQSRGPLALENPLRFSTEVTNATVFCFEERVVNPKTGSSCALKITIHPLHHKKAWKISPLDGRWTGRGRAEVAYNHNWRGPEAPPGEGRHTPSGFYLQEPAQTRPTRSTKSRPDTDSGFTGSPQHTKGAAWDTFVSIGGSSWLENSRASILGGACFKEEPNRS